MKGLKSPTKRTNGSKKRVLSPSARFKRKHTKTKQKSINTRITIPAKKSRRNPLRRSYLTKDLSELKLSFHKKRPTRGSWIARLATSKGNTIKPQERKKSIRVKNYYRSPRTECRRHGYDQTKCNNDPRCIMSARGCQMETIGVRHVVKRQI